MGFLLKIVIFAVAVYGIWATASRWYRLLGGGRAKPPPPSPAPVPEQRETAAAPSKPRRPVVEETRLCAACGSYVSTGAAKCGRPDCPQPA
jgi:hypothetical protein